MRIAVTGANGHLGANVVRDLLARGFEVRALCPAGDDASALDGLPAERMTIDVLEPGTLPPAFVRMDAVVNLAGVISIDGDRTGLVARTNIEGPRNVAQACLDSGVAKLVHVSSVHAYKSSPHTERFDEEAVPADETCFVYDRSKARGEDEVRAAGAQGLDVTIINPTGILGPHDHMGSLGGDMLRGFFRGRLRVLIDAGFDWVDARDVASAIRNAIAKGRRNENYLVSGRWASAWELADLCARCSNVSSPAVVLPWWTALAGLPFVRANSWLTGRPPLYTYQSLSILRGGHKNCSSDKARRELGYRARPLEETIADTHAWNRRRGSV